MHNDWLNLSISSYAFPWIVFDFGCLRYGTTEERRRQAAQEQRAPSVPASSLTTTAHKTDDDLLPAYSSAAPPASSRFDDNSDGLSSHNSDERPVAGNCNCDCDCSPSASPSSSNGSTYGPPSSSSECSPPPPQDDRSTSGGTPAASRRWSSCSARQFRPTAIQFPQSRLASPPRPAAAAFRVAHALHRRPLPPARVQYARPLPFETPAFAGHSSSSSLSSFLVFCDCINERLPASRFVSIVHRVVLIVLLFRLAWLFASHLVQPRLCVDHHPPAPFCRISSELSSGRHTSSRIATRHPYCMVTITAIVTPQPFLFASLLSLSLRSFQC